MKKETAINFMIYNLIGIDPETCNEMEEIIEQAIQRAYRDAASRVLSIKDDTKDEIKREAAQKLKSRIVSIDSKKESTESFGMRILVMIYANFLIKTAYTKTTITGTLHVA